MSKVLAEEAIIALNDPTFVREPGMCQKFVRQVIQAVYGPKFDRYRAGSAKEAAKLWEDSPFAIDPKRGSTPGDILYWTSQRHGRNGHVAIRIFGNSVCENSIVHHHPKIGGKGIRSIFDLDQPDLIVRLPKPAEENKL